jgi:hypothetical protein
VTTVAVKIAIIAGLAMQTSLGTAFAGTTDAPAQDEPLTVQSNAALHESDCQAIWSLAVPDNDRLSYDKATQYVSDLQAADPDSDGYFNKTEFMDACQKGLVHSVSQDTAIPQSHVMLRKR